MNKFKKTTDKKLSERESYSPKIQRMQQVLQIENIDADELLLQLQRIEKRLDEIAQKDEPETEPEYISRQDVASMFGISLPTVHSWTKHSILKGYKLSNKVYYKKSEVHEALISMTNKKGGNCA